MILKKLIKKINKENAPPDGWRPEDKVTSHKQQASSSKRHEKDIIEYYNEIRKK